MKATIDSGARVPVTLRPLVVEDAAAMVDVLADDSLYRFTGGEPPTEADLVRRYSSQVRGTSPDGHERWINLVVMLDAQPIGYVQATVTDEGEVAEIAWVIGRRWQGHGYARCAVRLLIRELANRGVRRLIAHIDPDHLASRRVARSIGMSPTGEVVDGEVRWSLSL